MRVARLLAVLAVTALATSTGASAVQDLQRYVERVEVARVIVDVRVTDDFGNPVTGLSAGDFRVKVDGHPVAIESVRWVSAADDPRADQAAADEPDVPRLPPAG